MIGTGKIRELWANAQIRQYAISVFLLIAGLAYMSLIIIPEGISLARISREANDMAAKIELAETRINRIDALKAKLGTLRAEMEKHSKSLPAEKEITALLEGFASIAERSGVRILSITPYALKKMEGSTPRSKYYLEMPIAITAKSGYHQLGSFVNNIEKEKRIMVVDDLQIRYDANTPTLHNVTMLVKTYVST